MKVSCEDTALQVFQRVFQAFRCQNSHFTEHALELGRHTRTDVLRPSHRHAASVVLTNDLCALEKGCPAAFTRPTLCSRHLLASWQVRLLERPKVAVGNCVEHQLSRFPRCDVGRGNCPGCFLMGLAKWESFSDKNLGEGFEARSLA